MPPDNFFQADALLADMATVLPTHQDDTSDLSSSLDAIALFVHSCMRIAGFRLLGFEEDRNSKIESELRDSDPQLLPSWNNGLNNHSFLYAHTQSSMNFVLRIDRLGTKVEIRGLAVGAERIAHMDLTAREYISSAALPVRASTTTTSSSPDKPTNDLPDLEEKLRRVFMSRRRMEDLAFLFKIKIIQKLLPGNYKDGWREEQDPDDIATRQDADAAGRAGSGARQPPPQVPNQPGEVPRPGQPNPYFPHNDPLAAPPRRPIPAGDFPPPDFEDEYEVNRPPRGGLIPLGGGAGTGVMPLGGFQGGGLADYGRSDLYPAGLGPNDPIRGSFVPGGLQRPGGRTGGMQPTFDDPLFRGPGGNGGEGYDSQVPPGARYDPVGPGGFPRFGGGGGGRGGRGGSGGFGGGFGDII
ncbi:PI31 proteasome regulator N-terminal domain containing protein [Rhypophila sp. PSN 637]